MKKPSIMAVLLFLTGLLCIVSLFFFTKSTTEQIIATEKDVDTVTEQITAKQKEFQTAQEKYTAAVDEVQNNINYLKQKAQTASQKQEKEKADISEEETTSKPSVFSQADASEPDNFSADNGHVVGIDPGHQGENVDMSAPEPIGTWFFRDEGKMYFRYPWLLYRNSRIPVEPECFPSIKGCAGTERLPGSYDQN